MVWWFSGHGEVKEDSARSASKSKEGNVIITIPVSSKPSSDTIVANDTDDAEDKLVMEPYYNDKWMNENFNIKISVTVGEKRILKKMRDSGNDFDLEVTYHYYSGTLTEMDYEDSDEIEETSEDIIEEDNTPPYLSMIIGTGCGRYI